MWPDSGVLILERVLPDELIDAYCALRAPMGSYGWPDCTPYMAHKEIRDLCLCREVIEPIESLVGEAVGLHLNLTGWISTERTWHQDYYLNPPYIGDAYCGAWFALADIAPDAGPFEYVPGSHEWGTLEQADVLERLLPHQRTDPDWPRIAEPFVTDHWDKQIAEHGATPEQFLAHRGDLLLWHPKIVHRGSLPTTKGKERRALIAHYSAVAARLDMPTVATHGQGRYFVL